MSEDRVELDSCSEICDGFGVQSYEDFVDEVLADMKADISMSDEDKRVLLGMLNHSYVCALIKQLGGANNG